MFACCAPIKALDLQAVKCLSKKNTWFKHYNNSSEGDSCQLLISKKDFETLYIYWWLLEQVSKFEEYENRGKVTLNLSYFKMKLGLNSQRTVRVLSKIDQTFDLKVKVNLDETVEVFIPKWLELQENRGSKKGLKDELKNDQKQTEERGEKKEERSSRCKSDSETESQPTYNITLPTIKADHPVSNFDARMKNQPWIDALSEWKLAYPKITNNLASLQKRFDSIEKLDLFLNGVVQRKKYKEIKASGDQNGCDNYLNVTILSEMGLM